MRFKTFYMCDKLRENFNRMCELYIKDSKARVLIYLSLALHECNKSRTVYLTFGYNNF